MLLPGPIDTPAQFRLIKPGDRLRLDGQAIQAVAYGDTSTTLTYVMDGFHTRRWLDARYAFRWDDGETERQVEYVGPGPVPSSCRAPQKRYAPAYD